MIWPPKSIAIVGGGAKAAAIAAKADVLNRLYGRNLQITIFEECAIGANWSGDAGYTDGEARLCTPAERDLGFPYDSAPSDRNVAERMYADYSWPSYLITTGKKGAQSGLKDWVNRGRLPPSHAEFARYLVWAVEKSSAQVRQETVTRLEARDKGWKIHRRTLKGGTSTVGLFDGVVFTGPGPALNRLGRTVRNPRVVDGRDFWRDPSRFLKSTPSSDDPVVIVGAGGTSAAIAARAVREPNVKQVVIIGDQAALFTRTETFFESQIFSDDALWDRLDPKTRRDFTDRLNRGVVWATISGELSRSHKVRFEPGRGTKIEVVSDYMGEEVIVHYSRGALSLQAPASLVIDASGFDAWWFAPLLPEEFQKRLSGKNEKVTRDKRSRLTERMDRHLVLFDEKPGPVHVPMLSQSVGPGFASLMVLGAMSDRILDRYKP